MILLRSITHYVLHNFAIWICLPDNIQNTYRHTSISCIFKMVSQHLKWAWQTIMMKVSLPENPSLNLHFVWLDGREDLKCDVRSWTGDKLKTNSKERMFYCSHESLNVTISRYLIKIIKIFRSRVQNWVKEIFNDFTLKLPSLKELNLFLTLILFSYNLIWPSLNFFLDLHIAWQWSANAKILKIICISNRTN